jgi:bifunctional non-homologous end joining protein LigD
LKERIPVEVDGLELELSNLDKVFYPQTGFTKAEVVDYYTRVSPVMLPHLAGRAVTLKRYPDGVNGEFFFEKECPAFHPDWVETTTVPSRNERGKVTSCVVENLATLVWLANLATLEFHTQLSRKAGEDRPDSLVFDLDPGPPADTLDAAWAALRLKEALADEGLECFPKTSGGKGMHVLVPLNTPLDFKRTKSFAHTMAQELEKTYPDRVTSVMRKELRKGKIFIDWSQNDPHKTTVCAYSLRAGTRPFVSAPVRWEELEEAQRRADAGALAFEAWEVLARVEDAGDLLDPVLKLKQSL